MIYTVTFNPAWDVRLYIDSNGRLVHRAEEAGGKGINVSRALTEFGIPNRAYLWTAGDAGAKLISRLEACGQEFRSFLGTRETRVNVKRIDEESGQTREENTRGETQAEELAWRMLRNLEEDVRPGDIIVLSGSLPPGFPRTLYKSSIERLNALGCRSVLDSSGEPFRAAASSGAWILAPNAEEFCAWRHVGSVRRSDVVQAALESSARILLSKGAEGALFVTEHDVLEAPADRVRVQQTSGAGDLLLAGYLAADTADPLSTDKNLQIAVKLATAFVAGKPYVDVWRKHLKQKGRQLYD